MSTLKRPFEFDLAACLGGELLAPPSPKKPAIVNEPSSPPPQPPPTEPEPKPEPEPQPDPEPEPEPEPEPKPKPEPEPVPDPEEDPEPEADPEPMPEPEHELEPSTPPRSRTPDPMEVLSPEHALLASLLNSGGLGSAEPSSSAATPAQGVYNPWKPPGASPGLLREDGGVVQFMLKKNEHS